MIVKKIFLLALVSLLVVPTAQAVEDEGNPLDSLVALISEAKDDSNKVNLMLDLSMRYINTAPAKGIEVAREAQQLGRKVNFLRGVAYGYKNVGIAHYYQGDLVSAMIEWNKSLAVFDSINDKVGIANILNNIGAVYYTSADYNNALEYYLRSLKVSEEVGDTNRIVAALTNIGAIYNDQPAMHDKALEYSMRALALARIIDDKDVIGTTSVNIGEIYLSRLQVDRALDYFERARQAKMGTDLEVYALVSISKAYLQQKGYQLALATLKEAVMRADELNARPNKARAMVVMGTAYNKLGQTDLALASYRQAASLAREVNFALGLKEALAGLSESFAMQSQYDSAFKYNTAVMALADSINSVETQKNLSNQLHAFLVEKKQNEINLLRKDQELKDLDIRKQKTVRNLVAAGFVSVIIFLLVVLLQKKKLSREKERSDKLLLNILPYEIAEELKETGRSEARDFDQVTVLFTDFMEFTGLSQKMTAKDLVEAINYYFKGFDEIISNYGIEKIKTIGDAYMAAGGLPVPHPHAVKNVVLAALEMQALVVKRQQDQSIPYSELFKMRVGVHSGPVVAGIVGVKKFQYDIWGDTVNTASRMESSGEVDKVNISGSTYEMIKNYQEFDFEFRGKVAAKGKGMLDMYFVSMRKNGAELRFNEKAKERDSKILSSK